MKKALSGASAAAVIALAPLCIPPAQAHADDPCASITDPLPTRLASTNPCARTPCTDTKWAIARGAPITERRANFVGTSGSESLHPRRVGNSPSFDG